MAPSVVMVVDANPATSRRIQSALQGTDLELRSASGMRDAIEQADDPELVAIFTAVSISGGNGYELTRRVVERRPDLAVYMLWGGFEAFDEPRAKAAGVRAGLRRPFSTEAILALIEEQLGALPVSSSSLEPMEPLEELLPVDSIEPLDTGALSDLEPAAPPVGDERLATFVPADYDEIPPVRVDREEISVGLERAVLAVLPEVLEAVLDKALTQPGRLRSLVEQATAQAVAEQLPAALERALQERLGEREEG
jgi:CheY-like chemotaxis protein